MGILENCGDIRDLCEGRAEEAIQQWRRQQGWSKATSAKVVVLVQ